MQFSTYGVCPLFTFLLLEGWKNSQKKIFHSKTELHFSNVFQMYLFSNVFFGIFAKYRVYSWFDAADSEQFTLKILHSRKLQYWRMFGMKFCIFHIKGCYAF